MDLWSQYCRSGELVGKVYASIPALGNPGLQDSDKNRFIVFEKSCIYLQELQVRFLGTKGVYVLSSASDIPTRIELDKLSKVFI